MKVYHLKTCDTCKKAIKALADRNPELIDVRADGVSAEVLARWLDEVGAETLINRRSTTWRNLTEAERAAEPASLLSAHPTLIKRPVIETDAGIFVGWTPQTQAALGV